MKSSFLKNYKKKVLTKPEKKQPSTQKLDEAIHYAFKLTDMYGIERINKSILEASIEFDVDENLLRERINDESFILGETNNE